MKRSREEAQVDATSSNSEPAVKKTALDNDPASNSLSTNNQTNATTNAATDAPNASATPSSADATAGATNDATAVITSAANPNDTTATVGSTDLQPNAPGIAEDVEVVPNPNSNPANPPGARFVPPQNQQQNPPQNQQQNQPNQQQEEPQQQGKLKVEDALAYLAKVKGEFQDDPENPHIYNLFLDIMKNFKSQQIDTPGVISQVSQLFRGHDHLILGFNTFLPPDQKISKDQLRKMNKKYNAQKQKHAKQMAAKNAMSKAKVPKQKKKQKNPPNMLNQTASQIPVSGNPGQPPFGFEHAITYVTKIKTRFERDSAKYTRFLDILHDYKEDKQSIEGVLEQVSELFRDHPDLLKEFAYFLPEAVQAQATARLAQAAANHSKKRRSKNKNSNKNMQQNQRQKKKQRVGAKRSNHGVPAKLPLIEKKYFERVKMALGQDALWMEFLKCLELYSHDLLSRIELLSLLSDVLSVTSDGGETLIDELELVLQARGDQGDNIGDEYWLSMPTTEIDFSQCRRCTPSYRALPHNYPRGTCSGRTQLCESVLNNNWVSVPTGSEDFGVKNLRRNQYEEALFKCEDDRYEIDMVMDANRSTIRALEPIAKSIEELNASNGTASSNNTSSGKYQFRLDKRALTVMHLKAVARVYGDAGDRVLELLRKNPAGAIPVILARLKQKAVEWGKARQHLDKQWKEVLEKNYQKSLDHRSFYFKTSDRKAVMAKTMLQEAKVAKHKAELKQKRAGAKKEGTKEDTDDDSKDAKKEDGADKKEDKKKKEEVAATSSSSSSSSSAEDQNKEEMNGPISQKMSTKTAVALLSSVNDPVTSAHMTFALPDVEAHGDVWSLMQHAAEKGNGSGAGSKFTSDRSRERLSTLLRDVVHPLLGSTVPVAWVDSSSSSASSTSSTSKKSNSKTTFKEGANVQTPYGEGKVSAVYADANIVAVTLPSGNAFVSTNNVYPAGSKKSIKPYAVISKESDVQSVLLLSNNKLYMFVRLYVMLYNRLRRAKELCRRASSQKKTIVRHWKDRVAATPRSPDHRGQPHKEGDAIDADGDSTMQETEKESSSSSSSTATAAAAADVEAASDESEGEEGLNSQLRSHKTYSEFMMHLYNLIQGDSDNATYEDTCRTLMGASTASYMMFTLDKLLNSLMKQASSICDEGDSEPSSKLQMLFVQERLLNNHESRVEYAKRTLKVPFSGPEKSKIPLASSSSSSSSSISSSANPAVKDMPENLFRIHFVPGIAASTVPIAGSHGPGVWDETMAWSVQPQICVELVNEASKLRLEATLDPSVVDAETYKKRYLTESGSAGFGGHSLPETGGPFLGRNRRSVEQFTTKQGSLGYEDKDTGRDRRARDQLNVLRHGLQWGCGTIRANEGLKEVISLETDKLRFVAGTEDMMVRVYTPMVSKKDKNRSGSSSDGSDGSDGDGEGEGSGEDGDGDVAMGNSSSSSSSSNDSTAVDATELVKKSTDGFDNFLNGGKGKGKKKK